MMNTSVDKPQGVPKLPFICECELCFTRNDKTSSVIKIWATLKKKSQDKGAVVAECVGCKGPLLITVTPDGSAEHISTDKADDLEKGDVKAKVETYIMSEASSESEAFERYEKGLKYFQEGAYVDAFAHWDSGYKWLSRNSKDLILSMGVLNNMGMAKSRLGMPAEALSCYEEALQLFLRNNFADDNMHATLLNNIGGAHLHLGNLDKAEDFHKRAYEIHLANPLSDPNLARRERDNLLFVYQKISADTARRGNFQLSIQYELLSAEIYERVGNKENLMLNFLRIGNLFSKLGHDALGGSTVEFALDAFQQAFHYHQKAEATPLICVEDLRSLSDIYRRLGRIEESLATLEEMDKLLSNLSPDELTPNLTIMGEKSSRWNVLSRIWSRIFPARF